MSMVPVRVLPVGKVRCAINSVMTDRLVMTVDFNVDVKMTRFVITWTAGARALQATKG